MGDNQNFSADDVQEWAVFGLAFLLGFVMFGLALYLVEEWVVASDLADRRRIREVLAEMLGQDAQLHRDGPDEGSHRRFVDALTAPSVEPTRPTGQESQR